MHFVFKILRNLTWLKTLQKHSQVSSMFRLLLPTIIREPQGSTKVTYVFCIYGENGMVTTACRFMYPMVLDML